MAHFIFAVSGQVLDLLTPTKGISDELNTNSCEFEFRSQEWNGLEKWAHFSNADYNDGKSYDYNLIGDTISPERGLNLPAGIWEVYLTGIEILNDEVVLRRVTETQSIRIMQSNVVDAEPLASISPSVAEQVYALAQSAYNARITAATADVDNEYGEPSATIDITGENGTKSLDFHFHNLKGNGIEDVTFVEEGENRGRLIITDSAENVDVFDGIKDSLDALDEYSSDSEAYARGTRNGTPVQPGDAAYQNNSKYYADASAAVVQELSGLTVSATTRQPNEGATAAVTGGTPGVPYNIAFGIPKGDTGAVPAFTIGTVQTGADAAAVITGTDSNPVLNLTLPKGDTGSQGPSGPDGDDGITPTIDVTSITGGHNVAFSYGAGDQRNTDFDVMDGTPYVPSGSEIADAVDAWLEDNVDPATGYVIDSSLTMNNAAPPASAVGALIDYIDDYGLSPAAKAALLACFRNVAWANANGQAYYDTLYAALYSGPTPPTPTGYVTSGLIAYWDGINNTGTGTHDSNALAWTDLANGYEFPLYETVNTTWDTNALDLNGNSAQGSITNLPLFETLAAATVEVVLKPEATGTQLIACLDTAASKVGDFYSARRVAIFSDNSIAFVGDSGITYTNPLSSLTAIRKLTATYTGFSVVAAYANGTRLSLGNTTHSFRAQTRKFILGSETPATISSGTNYPFTGKIYAIRVYNRQLTTEELAQNNAYDDSRFSLGM